MIMVFLGSILIGYSDGKINKDYEFLMDIYLVL